MLLLRFIILSLLFLFLKFIFYIFLYYICDVPLSPISEKSLIFGGTSTRPPCASPRTRVPLSRSLGGTLTISLPLKSCLSRTMKLFDPSSLSSIIVFVHHNFRFFTTLCQLG
jgi:hypothetical protein